MTIVTNHQFNLPNINHNKLLATGTDVESRSLFGIVSLIINFKMSHFALCLIELHHLDVKGDKSRDATA